MAQLAARIGVSPGRLRNIVVWGNHSSTQVPHAALGLVHDWPSPGMETSVLKALPADGGVWLSESFVPTVRERGTAVIAARGASSAMSAAMAIVDHMHDWLLGSEGRMVSMAVSSDGNPYGIPAGLIYSFPVVCRPGGEWSIVPGLVLDDWTRTAMDASAQELVAERDAALKE